MNPLESAFHGHTHMWSHAVVGLSIESKGGLGPRLGALQCFRVAKRLGRHATIHVKALEIHCYRSSIVGSMIVALQDSVQRLLHRLELARIGRAHGHAQSKGLWIGFKTIAGVRVVVFVMFVVLSRRSKEARHGLVDEIRESTHGLPVEVHRQAIVDEQYANALLKTSFRRSKTFSSEWY